MLQGATYPGLHFSGKSIGDLSSNLGPRTEKIQMGPKGTLLARSSVKIERSLPQVRIDVEDGLKDHQRNL